MTTKTRPNAGFSLLELMVAMMIIAVLGTIGFSQYRKYTTRANYIKAQKTVDIVARGLDAYFLNPRNNGRYPELSSFEAMVEPNSPLVKQSLIPVNVPSKDPWGNSYIGTSGQGKYELKCDGAPNDQEDFPAFTQEPGRISGQESLGQGKTPAAAPAPAGPPK
jgi:prepilin-type N-terminal cleavage/methylation domain-containing protein